MQNKSKSPFKIAFLRFIHNKIAMLSIILLIITIVSIIAPLIAPFPVNQQDLLNLKGEMTAQHWVQTLIMPLLHHFVICRSYFIIHWNYTLQSECF